MGARYETRIDGYIDAVCDSAQCALSHMRLASFCCMVAVQGQSFHADHVTEDMLLTELDKTGELNFSFRNGTQAVIRRV